jgi:hypothetical protein
LTKGWPHYLANKFALLSNDKQKSKTKTNRFLHWPVRHTSKKVPKIVSETSIEN